MVKFQVSFPVVHCCRTTVTKCLKSLIKLFCMFFSYKLFSFKTCATKLWVSRASVKMNHWTNSVFQLSLWQWKWNQGNIFYIRRYYAVRLLAIKLRIKTAANTWLFMVPLPVGLSQAHYIPVSHRKTAPQGRCWLLLSSCGSLGTRRTGLLFEVGLRPARKNTTQLWPMVISKNIGIEKWSTMEIRVRIFLSVTSKPN